MDASDGDAADQAKDDRAADDQPDEAATGPCARCDRGRGTGCRPRNFYAIAEDREGGRQEGEAADDRHQDDADAADRHRGQHVDAEGEQAGDGDGDGNAGEEHRATGGAAGDFDRRVLVATEAALRSGSG